MGGSVFGGTATGRAASPTTTTMYGRPQPKGWGGVSLMLLALVLLEAAALVALRHGFRHHHGG